SVRFDRPEDGARVRIDLVDLPVAVLADPQRALGPRQPRVAPAAGGGNRREDRAGPGVDLEDAFVGDLVEVLAVERGPGIAGDVEAARDLAARRFERLQVLAGGEPHQLAVEADAVHVRRAGERAVLADDLGRLRAVAVAVAVAVLSHRCSLLLAESAR